jgi:hypothetical protein
MWWTENMKEREDGTDTWVALVRSSNEIPDTLDDALSSFDVLFQMS